MAQGRPRLYTPDEAKQRRLASVRKAGAKWRAANNRTAYLKAYDARRPLSKRLFRSMQSRKCYYDITPDDIIVPTNCPICQVEMRPSDTRGGSSCSPTLDKVRPELGYVKGNIAVICKLCNSTKGSGDADLHRRIADYIDSFK